jgi:hypothetical protein
MFGEIVCPDPAYEQLKKSGLIDIIKMKSDVVSSELIDSYPRDYIVGNAKAFLRNNPVNFKGEKFMVLKDLLAVDVATSDEDYFGSSSDYNKLLVKHPTYLTVALLGNDIFKYREFGFRDRGQLEEAVVSFCFGEKYDFLTGSDQWNWRSNGKKNNIFRNVHGDLSVSQYDCSGKDYLEDTLFGKERVIECTKRPESSGFGAYQDWSEFLVSLLHYSKKIGREGIDEIKNWRGVLKEIGGGRGGFYTEAFGGRNDCDFSAHMLFLSQFMSAGEKLEEIPFTIPNRGGRTIPFFDGEESLLYLRESEDGNMPLMEGI